MNKRVSYIEEISKLLSELKEDEMDNILKAADVITESLVKGSILHLYGVGHSVYICSEAFHRAGGLVPVNIVFDPANPRNPFERVEGYAKLVLDKYDLRDGEPLIIVSNSGINPLVVEMAIEGKKRGAKVIAVTSLVHSKAETSRLSSGKKLFQVADITIDTHAPHGDAVLEIKGLKHKAVPASAILGEAVIDEIVAQVIQNMVDRGVEPPVLLSANIKGADEYNKRLFEKYKERLVY